MAKEIVSPSHLLNRLIELNKKSSFVEYPNRRHGIGGIQLDTLKYGFLEQFLPAGGARRFSICSRGQTYSLRTIRQGRLSNE